MQLRKLTEEGLGQKTLEFSLQDKWTEVKVEIEAKVDRMEEMTVEVEEVAVVVSEEKDNTEKSQTQEEDFKVRTMTVEEEGEEVVVEVAMEIEEVLKKIALVEEGEEVEEKWNAINAKESAIYLRTAQEEKQNRLSHQRAKIRCPKNNFVTIDWFWDWN